MLTIDLQDQVALVLGGSRGIGAAITECLCRAGAKTVFTHTGNPKHKDAVLALTRGIEANGGFVRGHVLDARDSSKTTALADQIAGEYGRLDILVVNAGQNIEHKVENLSDEEWRQGIAINLDIAFYGVRAVIRHMLPRKYGRIIFIGSSAAYNGGGGAADYAAGKAGLEGLMMYLAKTYARSGILCNTVHPAVIDTDLLRVRYPGAADRQKLVAQIPAGRLGRPEDIAGMAAFLASKWGDYICGQSILVDGGRTLFR